jgi:hypothetical protein
VSNPIAESNFQAYENSSVPSHYASLDHLTRCELLFRSCVKQSSSFPDLGLVAGGRVALLQCGTLRPELVTQNRGSPGGNSKWQNRHVINVQFFSVGGVFGAERQHFGRVHVRGR